MRILGGFRDDQLSDGRRRNRDSILAGTLDAGLGLALILASDPTSTWVRFVAAAWGLVAGTILLVDALRLRRFAAVTRLGASRSHANEAMRHRFRDARLPVRPIAAAGC